MAEQILAVCSGALALIFGIISLMQFREKGFLFHNAYIWATEQEREAMDKGPYYRRAGIAFGLCGAIFFFMGLEFVLKTLWLWLAVGLLSAAVLVYAVVFCGK